MHYLVLLYGDESTAAAPGTPEWDAELAGYAAFGELADQAVQGGAALHLSSRARTIRRTGGEVTVSDGPFAETTEALGGYYVLEAENLDDVIELVRHIPATAVPGGGSEIRPLVMVESSIEEAADQKDCWLATLHGPETAADVPGTPEWEAGTAQHGAFAAAAGDALVGSAAVQPAASATTVRVRDGEVAVSDGPFSAGAALVGGFYVLKGSDDQVLALARQIPLDDGGVVELRPLMDLSGA